MSALNYLTVQQLDSSEGNILVIDADSVAFMIGWHHRESQDIAMMHRALDTFMKEMFIITGAWAYAGFLARKTKGCFRYSTYKFKPYKGNRESRDASESFDWINFWQPIINDYLHEKFGFQYVPEGLETDDVVCALAEAMYPSYPSLLICSPDKDLRQVPGRFFSYKPGKDKEGNPVYDAMAIVSKEQAHQNLLMQLLTGDTTDNIAGIPGMGEKKAAELLKAVEEPMMRMTTVKLQYEKAFGPHYGPKIFDQTYQTVRMVVRDHPKFKEFDMENQIASYANSFISVNNDRDSPFS